jgi:hypothetical protein
MPTRPTAKVRQREPNFISQTHMLVSIRCETKQGQARIDWVPHTRVGDGDGYLPILWSWPDGGRSVSPWLLADGHGGGGCAGLLWWWILSPSDLSALTPVVPSLALRRRWGALQLLGLPWTVCWPCVHIYVLPRERKRGIRLEESARSGRRESRPVEIWANPEARMAECVGMRWTRRIWRARPTGRN